MYFIPWIREIVIIGDLQRSMAVKVSNNGFVFLLLDKVVYIDFHCFFDGLTLSLLDGGGRSGWQNLGKVGQAWWFWRYGNWCFKLLLLLALCDNWLINSSRNLFIFILKLAFQLFPSLIITVDLIEEFKCFDYIANSESRYTLYRSDMLPLVNEIKHSENL